MFLIQILLPLRDNAGRPIPKRCFDRLAAELTKRFKGLTAYTQAPAQGLWKRGRHAMKHDQIVVYEVMAPRIARTWWKRKRRELERAFRQERVLIRANRVTQL